MKHRQATHTRANPIAATVLLRTGHHFGSCGVSSVQEGLVTMSTTTPMRRSRAATVALLFGFTLSGCVVSKARYDELNAQHQAELTAHAEAQRRVAAIAEELRQTQAQLDQANGELQRERQSLEVTAKQLQTRAEELADIEHQYTVTQKEHEEANARVTQLREELARVATHLGSFAEERDELAGQRDQLATELAGLSSRLGDLEARIIGSKVRSLLVRDLSLALHREMTDQLVRLGVTSDAVVLTTRPDSLFARKSAQLTASGKRLLAHVGKTLKERTEVLQLEELSASPSGQDARMRAIAGALSSAGVPLERIVYETATAPEAPSPGGASTEQRLRIWIRPATPAKASAAAQTEVATGQDAADPS